MPENSDDVVDRVRPIRRKIPEEVRNDPEELVRLYQELDKKYGNRVLLELKQNS